MKADLQASEERTNWSWIQGRKERCDFTVAALGLPLRKADESPARWFALFGHAFEPASSRAAASSPWLSSGNEERHRVILEFNNVYGDAYPCLAAFEVQRGPSGVRILQDFHEPYLNGLTYGVTGMLNDGHCMALDPRGSWSVSGPGGESFGAGRLSTDASPPFLNPATIYGITTSIDADLWCKDLPSELPLSPRILVPLPEGRVRHESLASFDLRADYGDGRATTEEFTPRSFMPYLVGGRTIEALGVAGGERWSPVALTLRCGDVVVASARFDRTSAQQAWSADKPARQAAWTRCQTIFGRVAARGADDVPPCFTPDEVSSDLRPGVWRGRLQYNLLRGACLGDAAAVQDAFERYATLLSVEGSDRRYVVYNAEFLTEWSSHWISRETGVRLLRDVLLPMYAQTPDDELAKHAARLLAQGKFGLAGRAAAELAKRPTAAPVLERWARSVAAECGAAARDPASTGPFNAGGYQWSRELEEAMVKAGLCDAP